MKKILLSLLFLLFVSFCYGAVYQIDATDDLRAPSTGGFSDAVKLMIGHDGSGVNYRSFVKWGNISTYVGTDVITSCIASFYIVNVFTDGPYDLTSYNVTVAWSESSFASLTFDSVKDGVIGNTTNPTYSTGRYYNTTLSNTICNQWVKASNTGLELVSHFGESFVSGDHEIQINDAETQPYAPKLFIVTSAPNSITLNNPVNNSFIKSPVKFSFQTNFNSSNCSLYGDFDGTFKINQTIFNVTANTNTTFANEIVMSDSFHKWNVDCNGLFAQNNFTLEYHGVSPTLINISILPQNPVTSNYLDATFKTVTDSNYPINVSVSWLENISGVIMPVHTFDYTFVDASRNAVLTTGAGTGRNTQILIAGTSWITTLTITDGVYTNYYNSSPVTVSSSTNTTGATNVVITDTTYIVYILLIIWVVLIYLTFKARIPAMILMLSLYTFACGILLYKYMGENMTSVLIGLVFVCVGIIFFAQMFQRKL